LIRTRPRSSSLGLDAKEAENIALLDCALEEEEARQEAFGYSAAKREWRETCDADDAAFLASCAYVPRSPEEGKIKVEYLIATHELMAGFKDKDIEALLQSIAGGPPNV